MERTPSLSDLNEIVYGQVSGSNINIFYDANFAITPSSSLFDSRQDLSSEHGVIFVRYQR